VASGDRTPIILPTVARHVSVRADRWRNDDKRRERVGLLALNPAIASIHSDLGNVLLEQGHSDEAIACYRRALAIKPNLPGAHSNLGIALTKKGLAEAAIACFHAATPGATQARSVAGLQYLAARADRRRGGATGRTDDLSALSAGAAHLHPQAHPTAGHGTMIGTAQLYRYLVLLRALPRQGYPLSPPRPMPRTLLWTTPATAQKMTLPTMTQALCRLNRAA
jgi:tetratricopeptide (TPR) repeat protein